MVQRLCPLLLLRLLLCMLVGAVPDGANRHHGRRVWNRRQRRGRRGASRRRRRRQRRRWVSHGLLVGLGDGGTGHVARQQRRVCEDRARFRCTTTTRSRCLAEAQPATHRVHARVRRLLMRAATFLAATQLLGAKPLLLAGGREDRPRRRQFRHETLKVVEHVVRNRSGHVVVDALRFELTPHAHQVLCDGQKARPFIGVDPHASAKAQAPTFNSPSGFCERVEH
jgi:hypothetical protein